VLNRLRKRAQGQEGFTLIELLVVILIIGILAAIAIPSFLNQKGKGEDAKAKSGVRAVQTSFESLYTDQNSYTCASDAACDALLRAIETELPADADLTLAGTPTTWTATVVSNPSLRTFTISKAATGVVTRTCTRVAATDKPGGCTIVGAALTGTW